MKKTLQIEIPKPCHADWDAMTPNGNGRHCNLCTKTVVDFTKMTAEDIATYFRKNAGKKTCGHFYKGQLNGNKNKIQKLLYNLYCDAYLNLKHTSVRLAALVILGGLLTLTGCNTPTQGEVIMNKQEITGDSVAPVQIDSIQRGATGKGL